MRKNKLVIGEYYHIYNRGTDKRDIFCDQADFVRFWHSILDFNRVDPIGSMFEFSFIKKSGKSDPKASKPLVKFIAYCINSNHFHFLLTPLCERGIEKFMQKLGNGYTKYFNTKHKRSGVLFQGKFQSKLVDSNEYLLHISAYINTNNQLGHPMSKFSKSSLGEFLGTERGHEICDTKIILDQFRNKKEYEDFASSSLKDIKIRKEMAKDLEK